MTSALIQHNAARYKELTQVLAREHETSLALEECLAESDRLSVQLEAKQAELKALSENSRREFEQSRKLKHLSVRSAAAMLAGNKREKIAESEQRYHAAFENEQNCKRQIEQLSIQLGTVSEKKRQLQGAMDDVRDAKRQLTTMLDQIFAEPDPNYPLESQLKAELQNYNNQKAQATRDQGRFRDADHNLVAAVHELRKVQRLIDATSDYIPFDFFGGMLDSRQIQCLEAARLHVYEVQRRMNAARQILPEIPHAGTLDCVSNNAFLSVQINGMYVDVAWKAKAQHCYAVLSAVHRNIDNSIRWIRDYMQYTEGALSRLQVAIDSTQNALENERRRIVDHVLSGSSADAFQTGAAAADIEEPPPMYEGPPEGPPEDTAASAAPPPPTVPNVPPAATASPSSFGSNASSPYLPASPHHHLAASAPPTPEQNPHNPFSSSNPFASTKAPP